MKVMDKENRLRRFNIYIIKVPPPLKPSTSEKQHCGIEQIQDTSKKNTFWKIKQQSLEPVFFVFVF